MIPQMTPEALPATHIQMGRDPAAFALESQTRSVRWPAVRSPRLQTRVPLSTRIISRMSLRPVLTRRHASEQQTLHVAPAVARLLERVIPAKALDGEVGLERQ
jgi:hypothetical protein